MSDPDIMAEIKAENYEFEGREDLWKKIQDWMINNDEYREYLISKYQLDDEAPKILVKLRSKHPKEFLRVVLYISQKNEEEN